MNFFFRVVLKCTKTEESPPSIGKFLLPYMVSPYLMVYWLAIFVLTLLQSLHPLEWIGLSFEQDFPTWEPEALKTEGDCCLEWDWLEWGWPPLTKKKNLWMRPTLPSHEITTGIAEIGYKKTGKRSNSSNCLHLRNRGQTTTELDFHWLEEMDCGKLPRCLTRLLGLLAGWGTKTLEKELGKNRTRERSWQAITDAGERSRAYLTARRTRFAFTLYRIWKI